MDRATKSEDPPAVKLEPEDPATIKQEPIDDDDASSSDRLDGLRETCLMKSELEDPLSVNGQLMISDDGALSSHTPDDPLVIKPELEDPTTDVKQKSVDYDNASSHEQGSAPLRCDHCHSDFPSQGVLYQALQGRGTKHCEPRGAQNTGRKLIGPFGTGADDFPDKKEHPFACVVCGKTFPFKSSLATHARIHSDERPFACEICGKAFRRAYHLTEHSWVHSAERPYARDERVNFPLHTKPRDKGSAERPTEMIIGPSQINAAKLPGNKEHRFACDVCGKTFRYKSVLAAHARIHSDERPYACEVCGKAFRHSSHLTTHSWIHLGKRRDACDRCGKNFRRRADLYHHIRSHSLPYACHLCNTWYRDAGHLLSHLQRHGAGCVTTYVNVTAGGGSPVVAGQSSGSPVGAFSNSATFTI